MRHITALTLLLLVSFPAPSRPQRPPTPIEGTALQRLAADSTAPLVVRRKASTGAAFFVQGRIPLGRFTAHTGAEERGRDFFRRYGAVFGIEDEARQLALRAVTRDRLGMTHVRYDQRHHGLPVFGRQLVVHMDGLAITAINGDFADVASVAAQPQIGPSAAREKAMTHLGKRDPRAPAEPPRLLVHVNGLGRARLAWEVRTPTQRPLGFWRVFVDALDGGVLFSYDDLKTARNRNTYTNGNDPDCNSLELPQCILPGSNQRTELQGPIGDTPIDAAHDNAGLTYDYYFNTFGRDSYDGAGHTIRSTAHFGDDFNNAFWCDDDCAAAYGSTPDGEQIVYGDGDGVFFDPLSQALDVVAHELTHAVTGSTADLLYFDQSGALNESYSDVFAVMVDTGDFLLGEDVFTPGTPGDALRSLQDPTTFGDPGHFTNFVYTIYDGGGIHTNSGIPNKAAYLTVAGPGYGIGRPATQQIYYRALTMYLTPTSDFIANLNALVQSATDLYGAGSAQVTAIRKAQAAVGIANAPAVTSPNGGESLALGMPTTITWNSPGDAGIGFQVDALRDPGSVTYSQDFEASASLPAGFTSTGHQPWFIDTFQPDAGSTRSARSGIITHNERSLLTFTRTMTAPGNVSFRVRVSSEADFDFFAYWVDDVLVAFGDGEIPWGTFSHPVSAGTHQFVWVYEKDESVSSGSDGAWIDNLTIPNSENVNVESINPSTASGAVSQSWTPSVAGSNYRIRLLLPGLAPWLGADQSDGLFSVVTPSADLSIAKTDSPDPVTTGGSLTYTLSVTNLGPTTASNLVVTDPLPAGTSYVSATGTGWSCGHSSGTVTCTRPSLGTGAAPAITLMVTAPSSPGSISNTASVSSATTDPIGANNSSTAGTTVTSPPTPSAFHTVAPCRAADTRDPAGLYGGPALSAGVERVFTLAGRCGIPVSARAVSLNVTITGPTSLGHVSLYPGGISLPLVSTMNFRPGQTRANNAIIPLGTGGTLAAVSGQASGTVELIMDVNGYFE